MALKVMVVDHEPGILKLFKALVELMQLDVHSFYPGALRMSVQYKTHVWSEVLIGQ